MIRAIKPTEEQQDIINYKSHVVAIARPGSGKTFVLAEKIRMAVSDLKEHQGIIAISYTNKASDEIKRRSRRDGVDYKKSFFGTIDRFCDNEIIFPFLPHLWGHTTSDAIIVRIKDLPVEEQEQFASIEPNRVTLKVLEEHLALVRTYFTRGQLLLEMNGALALFCVQNSLACRNYLKSRYANIFVDEYQDSGLEQHELFLELRQLGLIAVAVGDINQSIFGFSGKDSKYLAALAGTKGFKAFPINYNHRCHPSIVNYSLRLLTEDSALIASDAMHVYHAHVAGDQRNVATWIGQKVAAICRQFDVAKMSEVAILVRRTHTGELLNSTFPHKHRFLRSHALEEHFSIWAKLFAKLLEYHFNDNVTAQEIIDEFGSRMLSGQEIRKCRALIRKLKGVELPELDDFVAVSSLLCPKAEMASAVELLGVSLQEGTLADWFAEPADDEVQILTIHKAKGMEFDLVFHLDLYEWVLPAKRPGENADWDHPVYPDYDQDLHLHYVGITRARKCCILCTSTRRINSEGQEKQGNPSEFLHRPELESLRRPITALLPPQ